MGTMDLRRWAFERALQIMPQWTDVGTLTQTADEVLSWVERVASCPSPSEDRYQRVIKSAQNAAASNAQAFFESTDQHDRSGRVA